MPGRLGVGYLQLVDDEEIKIFINRLCGKLLSIVLLIEILEFAKFDRLLVDCHEHRVGILWSGCDTHAAQCGDCQRQKVLFSLFSLDYGFILMTYFYIDCYFILTERGAIYYIAVIINDAEMKKKS